MIRWGIDLGGTKIEGIVLDTSNSNNIIARERVPTEGDQGYTHVLGQIQKLINVLKEKTQLSPTHLGIGTPGSLSPTSGLLKNSNSIHLNDKPVKKDLESLLDISVVMANDANCFALAEYHMGIVAEEAPESKVVFGVIMGTGVGGGLVVNGQIINGANGIGGEWGHNFLNESGGECYCGKKGCVETIISGPALTKYYKQIANADKSLQEIVKSVDTDQHAMKTIDRLLTQFGVAISCIINMIDPDAIVIGGGVGNIDALYSEGLTEVKRNVFNPDCVTKILKPKLGDSAGVFGAAFLD